MYQICTDARQFVVPQTHHRPFAILNINFQKLYNLITGNFENPLRKQQKMKGEKIMFFGFSDRADRNSDDRVDMWEAAEELYAYDSIMGTNISGFCPENDHLDSDLYDEDAEEFDEFDFESDDCDEW